MSTYFFQNKSGRFTKTVVTYRENEMLAYEQSEHSMITVYNYCKNIKSYLIEYIHC